MLDAVISAFTNRHGLEPEAVQALSSMLLGLSMQATVRSGDDSLESVLFESADMLSHFAGRFGLGNDEALDAVRAALAPPEPIPDLVHPLALGAFELHGLIGRGGMGEVWRGRHPQSDTPVAIKLITPDFALASRFQSAFRREVKAIATLTHRNICPVYDYGVVSEEAARASEGRLIGGCPWLAMALAEGTLHPLCGRLQWPALRAILLQLLDALAHTHSRGLVHRDIKPANVLVVGSAVQLVDFGLASAAQSGSAEAARGGGTPAFMAPEQLAGRWRDYGPWTDLYALGGTAWALAAGRLPFGVGRLMHMVIHKELPPLPPLQALHPVPDGFEAWLRRLMAVRPADRYGSAAEAAWDLMHLQPDAPGQQTSGHAPTPETATSETATSLRELLDTHMSSAPPLVHSVAPVPPDWRRPSPTSDRLHGAGLGLYGLRAIPFVGREDERDVLWDALLRVVEVGGARGVVLQGSAGVGKSKLARWLCERALELDAAVVLDATHGHPASASDGLDPMFRRHLRLAGLSRPEVAERVQAVLGVTQPQSVGAITELLKPLAVDEAPAGVVTVQLAAPAKRRAAVVELLGHIAAGRRMVLWLDDVQWGEEALALAEQLLASSDLDVLVLMTVRSEALGEHPESAAALSALAERADVLTVSVDPLTGEDRLGLIEELVGLSGVAASQVADRTAGNPLFAVQLVGDWVERGILVPAPGGFALAPGAEVPIPDAIHELWAGRLVRLLRGRPSDARAALELAALLGVEVDVEEWAAVCGKAEIPVPHALVEDMERSGLALAGKEDGWVFPHRMLAESILRIAREQKRLAAAQRVVGETLSASGERVLAQSRTRAEATFARAETVLSSSPHRTLWAGCLERLSFARTEQGQPERALDGLTTALAIAREEGDLPILARVNATLGYLHFLRGSMDEARERLDAARALLRDVDDSELAGRTLGYLGNLHRHQGRIDEAHRCYSTALALFREAGNQDREAWTLTLLGLLHRHAGRMEEAREHWGRALSLYREVGSRAREGNALMNLATADIETGRLDEARELLEAALALFRELGDRRGKIQGLINLATIHRAQGRTAEAYTVFNAALVAQREVGHRLGEGFSLLGLGLLHTDTGRPDEARDCYDDALVVFREVGHRSFEAYVLGNGLGELHLGQGRLDDAHACFQAALEVSREIGDLRVEGGQLYNMGRVQKRQGRLDEARACFDAALALIRKGGDRVLEGLALGELGVLHARSGRPDECATCLDTGEALLRDIGQRRALAVLLSHRTEALASSDPPAARAALAEAEQIAEAISAGPQSPLGRRIAEVRVMLTGHRPT